jgi:hypothetical protein
VALSWKKTFYFQPIWSKHNKFDRGFIPYSILLQLFAAITSFTFMMTFPIGLIMRWVLIDILTLDSTANSYRWIFFELLGIPITNLLLSSFISLCLIGIIFHFHHYFQECTFDAFKYLVNQEAINNFGLLDPEHNDETKIKTNKILDSLFGLSIGFAAGLLFGLVLFIPFSFVTIFLFLLFFTYLGIFAAINMSIFLSLVICYLLIMIYVIRITEIDSNIESEQKEYQLSKRVRQIIDSGEDPIICEACRSFIPAKSKKCIVCGELVEDSQD